MARIHRKLSYETLEARALLSSDVSVVLQSGVLKLSSSQLDSDFSVRLTGPNLVIESHWLPSAVQTVAASQVREIQIELADGADRVLLDGLPLSGNVTIRGTGGAKELTFARSKAKSLNITGIESLAKLVLDCSELTNTVTLQTGSGLLHMAIVDSVFAKAWNIRDTGGPVSLLWQNSEHRASIVGEFTGHGDRTMEVQDSVMAPVTLQWSDGSVQTELKGNSLVKGSWSSTSTGAADRFFMQDQARVTANVSHVVRGGSAETTLRGNARIDGTLTAKTTDGQDLTRILDQAVVGNFVGSAYRVLSNVTYAMRGTKALKADLYVPATVGLHPAIITIHGGSWTSGSRASMAGEAAQLAARGYVVMNVSYRLAPADPFPAQVHDVKSAVYWLRQNAATYGVDPNRIGAYGYSAGAHLALMLGVTDPTAGLEGPDAAAIPLGSALQAVVACAPPTDFRDVPLDSKRFAGFLGGTRGQFPENYERASPAAWVSPNDSPTHVFIGDRDALVSPTKASLMVDQLRSAGVVAEFNLVAGGNHLSVVNNRKAVLTAIRFLDQQFKS